MYWCDWFQVFEIGGEMVRVAIFNEQGL